ncbi:MAG: AEC family transporter [Microlunatus sp.]
MIDPVHGRARPGREGGEGQRVLGVLAGFVTIAVVIAVGAALAQWRILDGSGQRTLVQLSFFVASPCLMVTVLGDTDVSDVFSITLIASVGCVLVSAAIWIVLARLVWRRSLGDIVIGTFASSYVNAGNLGLPIAVYALGNATYIVPMLLTQMLILQPAGLMLLDLAADGRRDLSRRAWLVAMLTRPLRNPLTVGALVGLLLSITGFELPRLIADPLELIAGMAIPGMLLAYGVSLRTGPRPGAGEQGIQVATIVVLKLLVQPLVAILIAKYALGLEGHAVFAVAVVAGLPTAQNVFTHAFRYQRAVILARDVIFLTTILAVPALIVIAALLT